MRETALESTSATQTAKVTAVEETTSALETTSAAEQAKVVTLESKTSALESISTSEASKVSTLEASSSTVKNVRLSKSYLLVLENLIPREFKLSNCILQFINSTDLY